MNLLNDLIEANSQKRMDVCLLFAQHELTFEQLDLELQQLDQDLEVIHLNWMADERIVMHPFDLPPDELLNPCMN